VWQLWARVRVLPPAGPTVTVAKRSAETLSDHHFASVSTLLTLPSSTTSCVRSAAATRQRRGFVRGEAVFQEAIAEGRDLIANGHRSFLRCAVWVKGRGGALAARRLADASAGADLEALQRVQVADAVAGRLALLLRAPGCNSFSRQAVAERLDVLAGLAELEAAARATKEKELPTIQSVPAGLCGNCQDTSVSKGERFCPRCIRAIAAEHAAATIDSLPVVIPEHCPYCGVKTRGSRTCPDPVCGWKVSS
jgi:hypothetical protein